MLGKVKEAGIGYVVTNEGRFPIAASCSAYIQTGDDVIIVDNFVIASLSGASSPLKKIVDISTKQFGSIFLRSLGGAFSLLTETINIQAGKFTFNFTTMGATDFVARMSFGNVHIDASAEKFSLKYPGFFDIDMTLSHFKVYLYQNMQVNTKLLTFITASIKGAFNDASLDGSFATITIPTVQILVDSFTGMLSNLTLKGVNYVIEYTGVLKASAATISLSSRETAELNSNLGGVIVTGAQGVAISAVPGVGTPSIGMVTLDAPGLIHSRAPQNYLTPVPVFHTANAEPLITALTSIMAAITAITPFTKPPSAAASAAAAALIPAVTALSFIPNPGVMQ
jgi:hypothetical protein